MALEQNIRPVILVPYGQHKTPFINLLILLWPSKRSIFGVVKNAEQAPRVLLFFIDHMFSHKSHRLHLVV